MQITIDDKHVDVDAQQSLLANLNQAGIKIPQLCHHPKLSPQGRCSLCLVELRRADKWHIEHACMLAPTERMIIRTQSEHLNRARAVAASLLLDRGPFNNPNVTRLLTALAATAEPTSVPHANKQAGCILCGLCVNICQKLDKNHLTFLGRGPALAISYVGEQNSCGSCQACVSICPTQFIHTNGAATFKKKLY